MSENVYKFMSKRQHEIEMHKELLSKLDRCLELAMILEDNSTWREEYKSTGSYVYNAFKCIEDLR